MHTGKVCEHRPGSAHLRRNRALHAILVAGQASELRLDAVALVATATRIT